jgi:hypothetical protein
VLLAAVVVLRWPTWNDHILFIDEPYYHSVALRLQVPGTTIYPWADGTEPPLGPVTFLATVTYWLAIQISPLHAITVVHLFTSLAMAATALLLLATSACFLGSPWAGLAAGLLYVLAGSSDAGRDMFFSFSGLEHFQAPFLTLFILALLRSVQQQRVWLALAAGVSLGIAALYKINVVVLLGLPWALAAWLVWYRSASLARSLVLAGAATAAALATFGSVPLYYAAVGAFGSWRAYNVDLLVTYSATGGTWAQKAGLLAASIPLKPFLLAGLLYGVVATRRRDRSGWSSELGTVLALLWLALFVSLTPGHRKPHYLIQGLPAECLLIGMLATGAWSYACGVRRDLRPYLMSAYVAFLVAPLGYSVYGLLRGWAGLSAYAARDAYLDLHRQRGALDHVVRYVQANSTPNDLIYVHSEAPELYFLTQRLPAVADPVGSWIAHMPSRTLADSLLAQLQASPPRLIVQLDYRRYGRTAETLQKWPQIASWLHQHYRERTYVDHAQILEWQGTDAWPPPPAADTEVFLSTLPPEATVQTAGWLRFDRNQGGGRLRIGARTYDRGIGTHAASRLTYRLDGAYRTFTAGVGVDAAAGTRGSVVFTIEVDGVVRFTSPLARGGAPAIPVMVDVTGARALTLIVTAGGDGNAGDWADWAEARLARAER